MSNAQKIGGLSFFSWLWNLDPVLAAVTIFLIDFGVVFVLMVIEGRPPWRRTHYKSVIWGDTIFLPLYAVMVPILLNQAQPVEGFFSTKTWHITLLVSGCVSPIVIEWFALRAGQFTMSQEKSPAKLWHSIILGPMIYWCVSPMPAILQARKPTYAFYLAVVGLLGWGVMLAIDVVSIKPADAVLEGTYIPWRWYVRK